uniref:Uncharacterized protein n=1 Tax=Anopheles maculatus TaxID=74869 RepID=A0A182SM55_9DIPT
MSFFGRPPAADNFSLTPPACRAVFDEAVVRSPAAPVGRNRDSAISSSLELSSILRMLDFSAEDVIAPAVPTEDGAFRRLRSTTFYRVQHHRIDLGHRRRRRRTAAAAVSLMVRHLTDTTTTAIPERHNNGHLLVKRLLPHAKERAA